MAREAARHRACRKHAGELGRPGLDEPDGDEPAHGGPGNVDAGRPAEFRSEQSEELVRALRAVLQTQPFSEKLETATAKPWDDASEMTSCASGVMATGASFET